jgi:hypothetical protein
MSLICEHGIDRDKEPCGRPHKGWVSESFDGTVRVHEPPQTPAGQLDMITELARDRAPVCPTCGRGGEPIEPLISRAQAVELLAGPTVCKHGIVFDNDAAECPSCEQAEKDWAEAHPNGPEDDES